MRYIDEMQCAAARIVSAIREQAGSKGNNPSGDFDTFHIRRGDFQYKDTRISAEAIYENVKDILTEGATVYIATDEKSKHFFDPLRKHYDVLFMDDFMPQLKGVNKNYYGMIDQLVASRGRIFFGCWHST
jgi:GDP-fucose protein O-fucosyltransferase